MKAQVIKKQEHSAIISVYVVGPFENHTISDNKSWIAIEGILFVVYNCQCDAFPSDYLQWKIIECSNTNIVCISVDLHKSWTLNIEHWNDKFMHRHKKTNLRKLKEWWNESFLISGATMT